MKTKFGALSAILLVVSATLFAQQPQPGMQPQNLGAFNGRPAPMPSPGPAGGDQLAQHFFVPELLMQFSRKIGLTDEQTNYIKGEIQTAQSRFTDLQWQLQAEQESLMDLAAKESVDEKQMLSQVEKVLSLEKGIKQTQLTLLVRIKNKLTPEQQSQLRELRRPMRSFQQGAPQPQDRLAPKFDRPGRPAGQR